MILYKKSGVWRNKMNFEEVLEKLLCSFKRYYNIKTGDEVEAPFVAEAIFRSHNEQYFLIKRAKVADINSNEDVFFYHTDNMDLESLYDIDKCAWERGLSRVCPDESHRNSDVTLIILADKIETNAFKAVHKIKHYKSYLFGFHGWSNYRLVAIELSSKNVAYNRQGQNLKKLVGNIIK